MTDEASTTTTPAAATTAPTGEQTTAAGTSPAAATAQPTGEVSGDATAASAAPEQYDAFALPEGFVLEGERLEFAHQVFKENNLSQEQGQKLIDAFCKAEGENVPLIEQAFEAKRIEKIERWGQETRDGLGAKYDETIALARNAVAVVADPELARAFDEEGWGNHPALVRAFARFGELARGSGMHGLGGETAASAPRPLAERMYPQKPK